LAMELHAISALLAFMLGALLLRHASPQELSLVKPLYESRRWVLTVLPLALTAGMHLINSYADILMLGIFASAEEVGIYRVSVQGAMLVTFGISAIDMVVAPFIARLYAQEDMQRLQKIVTYAARFGAAFALLLFLTYFLFGEKVLSLLFGAEYIPGWMALVILSFGRLLNAVAGPVVFLLNMTGYEREMMRGVSISTALNIFLNLILIPEYGMEGASLSTAITVIFWNILLWRSARKNLGIDSTAFGIQVKAA